MRKRKNIKKFMILAVILLSLLIMNFTQAKYLIKVQEQYTQTAEKFFFKSDILENAEYKINDWDGVSTYIINNIDLSTIEDVIRYGDNDVEYSVEVLTDNASYVLKINGQEISSNKITPQNIEDLEVEVTPITNNTQMSVTLNVKSNLPYQKELKTIFYIIPQTDLKEYTAELIDSNEKNDPVLYIQNNTTEKSFKIQYDNTKVSLDISDTGKYGEIITNDTISYINITIDQNNVESIQFMKNKDYIGNTLELEKDIIVTTEN